MNRLSIALLGAFLLPLAACDSADEAVATADLEAVATVASALSVETGGALDDVAFALGGEGYAEARGPGHGGHGQAGGAGGACDATSSYDPGTGGLTRTITCERGTEGDRFTHTSTRSLVAYFVDADGEALPSADGAVSVSFEILQGTSLSTSPRGERAITETTGSGEVTGLDTDELTGNASGSRTGRYHVERLNGASRTGAYAVTLDLADLTGPTPARLGAVVFLSRWRRATSGTATGVYTAEVTTTSADGATVTRTVERPFEITFPLAGDGRGRLRMDGGDHDIDLNTGALL